MEMISDILLAAGALGAAVYCIVLAGRLKRFNNLQNGMGGAVAVLSAQVDDMTKTLQKAQRAAVTSSVNLTSLTERAEEVSKRLELMLASMHDLPETPAAKPAASPAEAPQAKAPVTPEPAPSKGTDAASELVFLSNRRQTLEAAE